MTNENMGLSVSESTTFLAPAASIAQLRERYQVFNQFVKDILHAGVDYQIIPGTDKPSLVKPGAEKLTALFGLSARFVAVDRVEDWMGEKTGGEPFFCYLYRCELYHGDMFVTSCDGSCNSREKKYRYRQADLVCPTCGKPNIRKSKNGPGWYCWQKTGGCGATFTDGDSRITAQPRGLIPNADIADQVNTIQKMAQKRAFVGATLIATNASEYFTQDIEEMPGFVEGEFVENTGSPDSASDLRYSPDQLKARTEEIARVLQSTNQAASSEKRGLVVHCLEGALSFTNDPKASRKLLTEKLTGYSSTKDMPDSYVLALYRWLNPHKDSGGDWIADEMAQREAVAALSVFIQEQESLLGES